MSRKSIVALIIGFLAVVIPVIYLKLGLSEEITTSVLDIIKVIKIEEL
ncbi:hypothetical protein UFOVP610_14 [uncultured Caudovirales phage]|uniref:Uncharacterized protein n=1 Tax=uncultured Caudovirales phage TaxID=2100421 RepID=A0A6J5N5G1_9CAUD|nr:hypothetical protein UFOVP610_14 [uncultured Caudovirales phage]